MGKHWTVVLFHDARGSPTPPALVGWLIYWSWSGPLALSFLGRERLDGWCLRLPRIAREETPNSPWSSVSLREVESAVEHHSESNESLLVAHSGAAGGLLLHLQDLCDRIHQAVATDDTLLPYEPAVMDGLPLEVAISSPSGPLTLKPRHVP